MRLKEVRKSGSRQVRKTKNDPMTNDLMTNE